MSRTLRKDRSKNYQKVPDGKQHYRCSCCWCLGSERKKSIEKEANIEIKNYFKNL